MPLYPADTEEKDSSNMRKGLYATWYCIFQYLTHEKYFYLAQFSESDLKMNLITLNK